MYGLFFCLKGYTTSAAMSAVSNRWVTAGTHYPRPSLHVYNPSYQSNAKEALNFVQWSRIRPSRATKSVDLVGRVGAVKGPYYASQGRSNKHYLVLTCDTKDAPPVRIFLPSIDAAKALRATLVTAMESVRNSDALNVCLQLHRVSAGFQRSLPTSDSLRNVFAVWATAASPAYCSIALWAPRPPDTGWYYQGRVLAYS